MWRRSLTVLLIAVIASPVRAQPLRDVKDVQGELWLAQAAGRRVGVELCNGSLFYGLVVEAKKRRLVLDEQKLGRRTIRYEDITGFLDPTTGVEIATVHFTDAPFQSLSRRARVLIWIAAAFATFVIVGCVEGACAKT